MAQSASERQSKANTAPPISVRLRWKMFLKGPGKLRKTRVLWNPVRGGTEAEGLFNRVHPLKKLRPCFSAKV